MRCHKQPLKQKSFLVLVGCGICLSLSQRQVSAQPAPLVVADASPPADTVLPNAVPTTAATNLAATLVATVQSLSGQMQVQRLGDFKTASLTSRTPLYYDDVTNTGAASKATLLFKENSRLDINSNSIVQLTSPQETSNGRRTFFKVIKGETLLHARSPLAVTTPSATIAVRGTLFDLKVDAQGTTILTVLEGIVEFSNAYGSVLVRANQVSVARVGVSPSPPFTVKSDNTDPIISWTQPLNDAFPTNADGLPAMTGANPVVAKLTPRPSIKHGSWLAKGLSLVASSVIVGTVIHHNRGHSNNYDCPDD